MGTVYSTRIKDIEEIGQATTKDLVVCKTYRGEQTIIPRGYAEKDTVVAWMGAGTWIDKHSDLRKWHKGNVVKKRKILGVISDGIILPLATNNLPSDDAICRALRVCGKDTIVSMVPKVGITPETTMFKTVSPVVQGFPHAGIRRNNSTFMYNTDSVYRLKTAAFAAIDSGLSFNGRADLFVIPRGEEIFFANPTSGIIPQFGSASDPAFHVGARSSYDQLNQMIRRMEISTWQYKLIEYYLRLYPTVVVSAIVPFDSTMTRVPGDTYYPSVVYITGAYDTEGQSIIHPTKLRSQLYYLEKDSGYPAPALGSSIDIIKKVRTVRGEEGCNKALAFMLDEEATKSGETPYYDKLMELCIDADNLDKKIILLAHMYSRDEQTNKEHKNKLVWTIPSHTTENVEKNICDFSVNVTSDRRV